jgi:DNA-binding transcriptional ArsR family regulator
MSHRSGVFMKEFALVSALDEKLTKQVAELFRTLSDPSRVRIIAALLDGENNVSELANIVGISESAISHQLRTLRQARLVCNRKQGREVFYSLDDDHVIDLFQRGLDHVQHG